MPRQFDNATQFYKEVEVERREAHKTPTLYFKFPLAWSFLLGAAAVYLRWNISNAINNGWHPIDFVAVFSSAIPMLFLLFYLGWWLRELMKLNRDAKPQQQYNPNPSLQRDWVRTVNSSSSDQLRAVFLHADDAQLRAIAEHIQAGGSFSVTGLQEYFGGNRAAVQIFYDDLVKQKPPMAEWKNPDDHRAGIRLLQEGHDHLYSKLNTPPPQEDEAPVYGRIPLYIRDTEEDE